MMFERVISDLLLQQGNIFMMSRFHFCSIYRLIIGTLCTKNFENIMISILYQINTRLNTQQT